MPKGNPAGKAIESKLVANPPGSLRLSVINTFSRKFVSLLDPVWMLTQTF